jgi:hypothetical protein
MAYMEPEVSVKDFIKYISHREPDLWRLVNPRVYKHTDQYGSPKVASAAIASSIMFRSHGAQSPISMNICMGADILSRYDFPHLFVHKELLNAVSATEPPDNLRWDSINLPYDAATLMLPKGWLKCGEYTYDFLTYARIRPFTQMQIAGEELITTKDTFMVFTMPNEPPKLITQLTINSGESPYVSTNQIPIAPIENISIWDEPLSADEDLFMANCLGLVFRLLLAMESRPTLLSRGQRLRVSHKKSRPSLEIWTPNIVGLNYRYSKGEGHSEGGGHVRMHWRRGHFTRQAYGPGRTLRKTLWLEPVLVGGNS